MPDGNPASPPLRRGPYFPADFAGKPQFRRSVFGEKASDEAFFLPSPDRRKRIDFPYFYADSARKPGAESNFPAWPNFIPLALFREERKAPLSSPPPPIFPKISFGIGIRRKATGICRSSLPPPLSLSPPPSYPTLPHLRAHCRSAGKPSLMEKAKLPSNAGQYIVDRTNTHKGFETEWRKCPVYIRCAKNYSNLCA